MIQWFNLRIQWFNLWFNDSILGFNDSIYDSMIQSMIQWFNLRIQWFNLMIQWNNLGFLPQNSAKFCFICKESSGGMTSSGISQVSAGIKLVTPPDDSLQTKQTVAEFWGRNPRLYHWIIRLNHWILRLNHCIIDWIIES